MNDPLPIRGSIVLPASELSWEFTRAGGPGGQHVNKTETLARLRFDLDASEALSEEVKARLRARFPAHVTGAGALVVACSTHRSRHRNTIAARDRLAELVRSCLDRPRPRKKTRPTRSSKRKRLDGKRRRGDTKKLRGRVTD